MAITVDWAGTNVGRISIPKADTTYVGLNPFGQELRSLDIDTLRLTLRDLEDDPDGGRPWPKTHNHETETILAGVTYARKVTFLAPYYFVFEAGDYRVDLLGANNNLVDRLQFNGVTVVPQNSAGLIKNEAQSIGQGDLDNIRDSVWSKDPASMLVDTIGEMVVNIFKKIKAILGDL